jgi:dephospho-CoA kinase
VSLPTASPIAVEPHDRRWPHRGAQLVAVLRAALGPLALRLEHVGATSIPGMPAKPVFDLQVSVRDLVEAAGAFDAPLAALGLRRRPDEVDRVPARRRDDPRRWAKRRWSGTLSIRDASLPGDAMRAERVDLHARVAGAPNERVALLFRDWFRAHPEAVPGTELRGPAVDLVVVTAEAWADRTGWRP